MILELTNDEIDWVKYSLIRASAEQDKEMTLKEERLLLRIVRKIERQEKQRGEGVIPLEIVSPENLKKILIK